MGTNLYSFSQETCKRNPLCLVWEYQTDQKLCTLRSAHLFVSSFGNDSFSALKNCKEGHPSGDLILSTRIFGKIFKA